MRYGLLKYIYTIFVAKKGLGTIWKPLIFVFPTEEHLYEDNILETEFMFGTDLLFIPLLEEGKNKR
jgi:alpha-glucosidase (family GH31 glycosyl hydrolase)